MSPASPEVPIKSPCVSLCKMDTASGLCQGCYRTIDEIIAWSKATNAYKSAVWAQLEERRAKFSGAAGHSA